MDEVQQAIAAARTVAAAQGLAAQEAVILQDANRLTVRLLPCDSVAKVSRRGEEVAEQYPGRDRALLEDCRGIVLAMVAAWRWNRDDRFPGGELAARDLIEALRQGPPWPALDEVMPPPSG